MLIAGPWLWPQLRADRFEERPNPTWELRKHPNCWSHSKLQLKHQLQSPLPSCLHSDRCINSLAYFLWAKPMFYCGRSSQKGVSAAGWSFAFWFCFLFFWFSVRARVTELGTWDKSFRGEFRKELKKAEEELLSQHCSPWLKAQKRLAIWFICHPQKTCRHMAFWNGLTVPFDTCLNWFISPFRSRNFIRFVLFFTSK